MNTNGSLEGVVARLRARRHAWNRKVAGLLVSASLCHVLSLPTGLLALKAAMEAGGAPAVTWDDVFLASGTEPAIVLGMTAQVVFAFVALLGAGLTLTNRAAFAWPLIGVGWVAVGVSLAFFGTVLGALGGLLSVVGAYLGLNAP